MVDFFHQCSERNKKAIYGTPNARASCMSWKNLVPSKCHKWNTTLPPSLYSTRFSPMCTTKRTKTRGQKRNICETWGRTKKEKLLNWAKYRTMYRPLPFPGNGCFYAPISRVIRGMTHLMKSIMDRMCSIHQSRQSLDE